MCKHLGWEETLALFFACIKFSSIRFTRPTMGRIFMQIIKIRHKRIHKGKVKSDKKSTKEERRKVLENQTELNINAKFIKIKLSKYLHISKNYCTFAAQNE